MKRIFESPTPLAFFGFLLTFLLTVAWRMPLDGQTGPSTTFLGLARASALPPPAPEPTPEPAPVPQAIPQVIAATATQPPVFALPVPQGATPVAAPAPTMLPAIAQAVAPVEPVDAMPSPAKKKVRHARKAKAVEAQEEDVANLLSAATESKPKKRR